MSAVEITNGDAQVLSIALGAIASIAAVAALLLVTVIQFPRIRRFLAWSAAWLIDPDGWDDPCRWDEFRRGVARWLDSSLRFSIPDTNPDLGDACEIPMIAQSNDTSEMRGEPSFAAHIASQTRLVNGGRSTYRTYLSDDGLRFIKQGLVDDGNRVLRKEALVIRQLRSSAGTSAYKHYFPFLIRQEPSSTGVVMIYRAAEPSSHSAVEIHRRYPQGVAGRHVAWMFNRMLEAIGYAHLNGTVHAAVMPQHLWFDCDSHGLQLTDWTHAKRIGQTIRYLPRRYRKWYPDSLSLTAEPSLDIYMAAKSALYLAGVDGDSADCLEPLPRPIDRLLRSCLFESSRMRPNDAWQLHQEFRDLLETVYGEPEFCSLSMDRSLVPNEQRRSKQTSDQ